MPRLRSSPRSPFHEDYGLPEFIVKAFRTLDRADLIEHSWLYHGQALDTPNSFSMAYTIPRKFTDQVQINNVDDFKQMVKEATYKIAAEVKLFLVEHKVSPLKPIAREPVWSRFWRYH